MSHTHLSLSCPIAAKALTLGTLLSKKKPLWRSEATQSCSCQGETRLFSMGKYLHLSSGRNAFWHHGLTSTAADTVIKIPNTVSLIFPRRPACASASPTARRQNETLGGRQRLSEKQHVTAMTVGGGGHTEREARPRHEGTTEDRESKDQSSESHLSSQKWNCTASASPSRSQVFFVPG